MQMNLPYRLILITGFAAQLLATAIKASETTETAQAKFVEGVRHFESENYESALALFEESYALRPSHVVLFNIAMCEKALLRYAESTATFERLLSTAQTSIKNNLVERAEAAVREMSTEVGRLAVDGAPEKAELSVDGVPLGKLPLQHTMVLSPGKHAVAVTKPGYVRMSADIDIIKGTTVRFRAALSRMSAALSPENAVVPQIKETPPSTLQPAPINPEAPVPSESPKQVSKAWLVSGIAAAVLGVAGIGVGIGYSIRWKQHHDDVVEIVDNANRARQAGNRDLYNDYLDQFQIASDELKTKQEPADRAGMIAGYTVGGVLAATGIVLLIVYNRKQQKRDARVTVLPGGVVVFF
jgi:hypothetical protein